MEGFLLSAFVFLCAAIIVVPIAGKLGLGSVLGYLCAGVVIGPSLLGFIKNPEGIMHSAEFGVVMMLFLIGLELQPTKLWKLRRSVVGIGGMQVLSTTAAITLICSLLGLDWKVALAIGLGLALSSTAIALQTLNERQLMNTQGGRTSFAVLLFQDIAVIPMLALMPLLAATVVVTQPHAGEHAYVAITHGLPAWQKAVIVMTAITGIIVIGRFLIRPAFRYITASDAREIFTAFALAIVIGIALLMQLIGLSPALGAFIAGVVLANSEYRHELETDIEPFKGLLMGLFFIAVGASINFTIIQQNPWVIVGAVLSLITLKATILFIIGKLSRVHPSHRWLMALILAQGSEFAFVLFDLAFKTHVLNLYTTQILMAVIAISMAITPLLMILYERSIVPRYQGNNSREADEISHSEPPVIIAGFGRFGQMVGRVLYSQRINATVLDHDPNQIEMLRKYGFHVFYGDATRLDLLESAGAQTAKIFIIAIDDVDKSLQLAALVRKHFPDLHIIARARNRRHAYELIEMGIETFEREVFSASMNVATYTLESLGYRRYQAQKIAKKFAVHDRESLIESATFYHDEEQMISHSAQARQQLDKAFESDNDDLDHSDKGWG